MPNTSTEEQIKTPKYDVLKPEQKKAVDSLVDKTRISILSSNNPRDAESKKLILEYPKQWADYSREMIAGDKELFAQAIGESKARGELSKHGLTIGNDRLPAQTTRSDNLGKTTGKEGRQ